MNPDPQIVPKFLEEKLIENQPELDPAYNVELFLNDNKTIEKMKILLKSNNFMKLVIDKMYN